jgi:hypothetical protein
VIWDRIIICALKEASLQHFTACLNMQEQHNLVPGIACTAHPWGILKMGISDMHDRLRVRGGILSR